MPRPKISRHVCGRAANQCFKPNGLPLSQLETVTLQEDEFEALRLVDLEGMQQQAEMNKLGFQSEAQNRINSMQPIGFAETLFNVVEPIAGFAVNYADTTARYADLEN